VLRTWLDRSFKEDFYKPPHHSLLKRLLSLAEEYKKDEDLSDIFTSSEDECDFLTFTKSRLQTAEVKGLQEEACESKQKLEVDFMKRSNFWNLKSNLYFKFLDVARWILNVAGWIRPNFRYFGKTQTHLRKSFCCGAKSKFVPPKWFGSRVWPVVIVQVTARQVTSIQ